MPVGATRKQEVQPNFSTLCAPSGLSAPCIDVKRAGADVAARYLSMRADGFPRGDAKGKLPASSTTLRPRAPVWGQGGNRPPNEGASAQLSVSAAVDQL